MKAGAVSRLFIGSMFVRSYLWVFGLITWCPSHPPSLSQVGRERVRMPSRE